MPVRYTGVSGVFRHLGLGSGVLESGFQASGSGDRVLESGFQASGWWGGRVGGIIAYIGEGGPN